MTPQVAPLTPTFLTSVPPRAHSHVEDNTCPTCEQVIPPERLKEISGKIAAKMREHDQVLTSKLEWQFSIERAEAEAKSAANLQVERQNSAAREAAAHQAAQAAVTERLAEIERDRVEAESTLKNRAEEVERIRVAAEEKAANLQLRLDQLGKTKDAEIAKVKEEAAASEQRIRQEATTAAAAQVREQLDAKDQAVADAQAKSAEAESKLAKLAEQHESTLSERLGEQREILEKAKDEAVSAERAKAFDETEKLRNKVSGLQRELEKKTSDELGEGAEIDLYEALRKEFPDDRIERIAKGVPGADIHHVVVDHGRECGTIIYDSKNHKAFRAAHVAKLAEDQIAARAEHAILSLHKFPENTAHLHMRDGVILANPARVVSVVTLIRRHMVQAHILRLSNAEREDKTARLYAFITSERYAQLLDRIEQRAGDLLDLQDKEIRWHNKNWEDRGKAYRAIQRAKAELDSDIHNIIGSPVEEVADLEESEL